MKIIKQELQSEKSLKQKLEFICEFSKVTPTFITGSIRKIKNTNLIYIQPHRVIVKNITFLVFIYSNDVYISNIYGTNDIVEDVKQVYLDEFEQDRIEFNNKQTRKDRKIDDYFQKVCDSQNDIACEIIQNLEIWIFGMIKTMIQNFKRRYFDMEKVKEQCKLEYLIDMIKEMYNKFESKLKEIDEEYGTTLINFGQSKYFIINFAMAKLMEMEQTYRNKVALYLFNNIKIQ